MLLYKKYMGVVVALFVLAGCKQQIALVEKTTSFTAQQWPSAQKATIDFLVEDTTANYNIFFVLRHTDAYRFNNIWLTITSIPPGDSARSQQINIALGDSKKWLGNTIDDIVEHRTIIFSDVHLKKGTYHFLLQQIMREDPLQNVLQAGIRIEKIQP